MVVLSFASALPAGAGGDPGEDQIVTSLSATSITTAQAAAGPRYRPSPVRWFTQGLGHHVGRVEIPAIGVSETIRAGVDLGVLDRGVGHWAGSAQAAGEGNMVLAGHRTTWSKPFHDIDRLVVGDIVHVTGLNGQLATYRVSETLIVEPHEMWIAGVTVRPTLTLFACHPKGSAAYRIVVRAELQSAPVAFP
jgi:sortase A